MARDERVRHILRRPTRHRASAHSVAGPAAARRQARRCRSTPTCSTPTATSPRVRPALARGCTSAATARVLHAPVGDCDLGVWFDAVGDGPGLLILDVLSRSRRGREPHRARAGRRRPICCRCPAARDDCFNAATRGGAHPDPLRAARRRLRRRVRPWPQIVESCCAARGDARRRRLRCGQSRVSRARVRSCSCYGTSPPLGRVEPAAYA